MNLPEPSGSSPPEKPPGRKRIWLSRAAWANRAADSATLAGVWLFSTRISGVRPARSTARALSYSQLVPGNTGMSTFGLAAPALGAAREKAGASSTGTGAGSAGVRLGYTSSSTDSLRESSSSMGAESPPRAITGSAVVMPMRLAQDRSTSSVSSATMAPGRGMYQREGSPLSAAKPMRLPKDISMTASAMPCSTAQADLTLPARHSWWKSSQTARWAAAEPSDWNRYTGCPASLNSGDSTSPARMGAMAKEINVGGTSRSLKVPDMESLPPMAAAPKSSWASRAPSRAAKGLPQRRGSSRSFSKNSWRVR